MAIQIYDSGIETGTKYLTVEVAYFLGGIYAADESYRGRDRGIEVYPTNGMGAALQ